MSTGLPPQRASPQINRPLPNPGGSGTLPLPPTPNGGANRPLPTPGRPAAVPSRPVPVQTSQQAPLQNNGGGNIPIPPAPPVIPPAPPVNGLPPVPTNRPPPRPLTVKTDQQPIPGRLPPSNLNIPTRRPPGPAATLSPPPGPVPPNTSPSPLPPTPSSPVRHPVSTPSQPNLSNSGGASVYQGTTIPIQKDPSVDLDDTPRNQKTDASGSGLSKVKNALLKPFKKKADDDAPPLSVGMPYNVQHNIHVDFNSVTGFEGLPPEWEVMLKTSGITKDEVMDKPEIVLDLLNFNDKLQKNQEAVKPVPPPQNSYPEDKPQTLSKLPTSLVFFD